PWSGRGECGRKGAGWRRRGRSAAPRRGRDLPDARRRVAMNFFERQAQARRNTTRLVVLFALAVVGLVVAVDLVVLLVFGRDPALLAVSTLLALGVIGIGSLSRRPSAIGGGASVE